MNIRKFLYNLSLYIFYPCRIKRSKVVFMNFNGKGYGDNPKYIAEEIIREKKDWDLVWLVINMNASLPKEIRKVKFRSLRMRYEMQTAKIIITNSKTPISIIKKKKQYIVQTWHAPISYKKVENDAKEFLREKYLVESKKNSEMTDLFISSNSIQTEEYKRAFWCKCEILQCGIPRNDIYFNFSKEQIDEIRKKTGFSKGTKLVLYAPTFRDKESKDAFTLDYNQIIKTLEETTNSKWKLLVRFHPAVKEKDFYHQISFNSDIINMTEYPDMQELLLISDVLITDVSSSIYDCTLLRKPIFLFMPDFDFYTEYCRGLTKEYFHLPYTVYKSNEDLQNAIKQYDINNMRVIQETYLKRVNGADNGHAAIEIVKKIESFINK